MVSHNSRRGRAPRQSWATFKDEELLQLRLKDLDVSFAGTWLEDCLDVLNEELAAQEIVARAHGWISDEWFSPANTLGISFPFYLFHPRLMRLERKMVLDVEGGTQRECMRILRHEAGHVIQHAYVLHRRRRWQELFGRSSIKYPEYYRPNPESKDFVQHLRRWYGQSHPDEDFAETFAVWLTPRSNWRKRYADWPALAKLEYVDELMGEIAGEKPMLLKRVEVDPIGKLTKTLGEHYKRKLEHYAVDTPATFDRELRRIFSDDDRDAGAPAASAFIRRNRAEIRKLVSRWTGEYELTLDAVLDDMIDRCRALKLRAPGSEHQLRMALTALLTNKAVHSLYSSSRRQWFAV
jgi:hypothetical protein